MWATVCITVLSFIVWLHHFFTMGAGANVNAFFGITTMIIAIPTGVKIFNWLFTMYQGRIVFNSGDDVDYRLYRDLLRRWDDRRAAGGTGARTSFCTTACFLIAHFHNVIIGGVVFGCFAGLTYWWPKAFGFTLNETWGQTRFLVLESSASSWRLCRCTCWASWG
ncbi:cytochrome O ubiquinol oxidase subunit I [Klebsiella variicola]|nr:cytochrome O ubiquinol oxidase subunit I [Klebsiella variicola]